MVWRVFAQTAGVEICKPRNGKPVFHKPVLRTANANCHLEFNVDKCKAVNALSFHCGLQVGILVLVYTEVV